MTLVYLALGSNVGDSKAHIDRALELLGTKVKEIKRAPIYSSKPVGYTDQDDFLNTAISGQTTLKPEELLKFVKSVEAEVGRVKRFRWGPREIDIDIIFYGNQIFKSELLEIPHPRFGERDFVLRPIADLDPGYKDPRSRLSVKELLEQLPKSELSILANNDI